MSAPKNINLKQTIHYFLLLFLFLLPWQTRWVYERAYLNGRFWEYGSKSIYATEVLLIVIVILFLIDRVKNREIKIDFGDQKKLLLAFWSGGVLQGLLATWQFFSQSVTPFKFSGLAYHSPSQLGDFVIEASSGRWLRAYGAFGSPNILGGFLAVVLVVGLIIYLRMERPLPALPLKGEGIEHPSFQGGGRRRSLSFIIGFTIGQLIILSGLILSFSRAAWLATAIGVVCVIASLVVARRGNPQNLETNLVKENRGPRRFHWSLWMTLTPSLLILFFLITLNPLFLTRIESTGRLEQNSISERVSQLSEWHDIMFGIGLEGIPPRKEGGRSREVLSQNITPTHTPPPLYRGDFATRILFGIGPGAYTLALYKLNPTQPSYFYQPIHNAYLLMLAEIGIVGCFLAFLLSCFLVRLIWKKNKIFISILIVIAILALFDHWLWSMYFGNILWFTVLGFSINKLEK